MQGGAAGGILPSSLIELSEHFLGTRDIHPQPRRITAQPLGSTWLVLGRPLDPDRREYVDFTSAAFYSPMAYLPQTVAIMGGRSAGAGPLALLYLARLANALVAVALLTSAVRLMPIGREAVMVAGLLPMAVFEYASAAPDAWVIGAASSSPRLLCAASFAAAGLRRGRGRGCERARLLLAKAGVRAPTCFWGSQPC